MNPPPPRTCFVIMPFGEKKVDNLTVDFDRIYDDFIVPTIESAGLRCERCDRKEESGHIHAKMFEMIWTADVALVDISLLNPNVFYELGIRHALRKSVTVIMRRKGTRAPFNIASLNAIEYVETDGEGMAEVRNRIHRFIEAGFRQGHTDNEVSRTLDLRISSIARVIPVRSVYRYALAAAPAKQICIITGDIRNIHGIDIWVNSENTNMQMARFYEPVISSVIRYEGAKKSVTGHVKEDTIHDALQQLMDGQHSVPPGQVIATTAGELTAKNGVKYIFHVAAVHGSINQGYQAIDAVDQCVTNALKLAGSANSPEGSVRSILFPLLGISTRLKSERETVESLFTAAASFLADYPDSRIEEIYFLAWSDAELKLCQSILDHRTDLRKV